MAACGRTADGESGSGTDTTSHEAATAAEPFTPGSTPAGWLYRITFTPDGDTAYYTVSDGFFPANRRSTIHRVTRDAAGTWGEPHVASFSGEFTDIDPFVTPDGQRLFFSSIRPDTDGERRDLDIFYVERTAAGWSEPVRLGPEVNSPQDELYASMDDAGTLFFACGPLAPGPGAGWDIYTAAPAGAGFAPRQPLEAVNTTGEWDPDNPTADWEFNPEVSRDGRTLVFTSLRPGGFGLGDLYVSHRHADGWSTPVNLGPLVNTGHDEFHPTLSPDGDTLYFARTVTAPDVVPSRFHRIPLDRLPVMRR